MRSRLANLLKRISKNRPENLRVVLLAIATATVFWLFNALNKEYDATLGYPIDWEFDSEQYIVVEELPSSIRINVKGLGWNLLRASLGLKVNPITIALPNPAVNKKVPGISLTNRVDDDLEELQLNYILDDTLHMNIDFRDKRSFAVYIDSTNISLAENYRIVSPVEYDTHLLEIEGPRDLLYANPSDSFLISIQEDRINSNFEDDIEFTLDRSDLFRFNPSAVNVRFQVAEFTNAQRVVRLEAINFPADSSVTLADTNCMVEFTVRRDLEPTVVADSFKISADYNLLNTADSTLLLRLESVPVEVLDTRITHPQVRVNYNE